MYVLKKMLAFCHKQAQIILYVMERIPAENGTFSIIFRFIQSVFHCVQQCLAQRELSV